MERNEKPLPKPPKTPFGRKRADPEEGGQELLADKMAEAAAFGNLDEFMERELPDSEHARALASMMMGMSGMLPQSGSPAPARPAQPAQEQSDGPSTTVPDAVREAVQAGDVKGLIEMLRQEHLKRSGSGEEARPEEPTGTAASQNELPAGEREVLDRLIAIARENNTSPDWIILRALKLYIQEYERTGRL